MKTRTPLIDNNRAGEYVAMRNPFLGRQLTGRDELVLDKQTNRVVARLYVVRSHHVWPLWVYHYGLDQWFGNSDYWTPRAQRHKLWSNPRDMSAIMLSKNRLDVLLARGTVPPSQHDEHEEVCCESRA